MLKRNELEQLHSSILAVLCQKVADVPDSAAAADHALTLKHEWARLQTPPSPNLQHERDMDAKRQAVRVKMLEFLDGRTDVDHEPKR
jgi:hypothetical protein